ncbi:MAG TPA: protein translocase subunit SecF [Elusimicrobia bacterium]|nr:protein translocase subunit SecF [Elusimicrobiota bacterium]HBT62717.1 protein translocase subunit SecF [Elusimicrobiota bacterium]
MEFLQKTNIDFVGFRRVSIAISLFILIGGISTILLKGFNYSIEFTGGTLVQVAFDKPVDVAQLRAALKAQGLSPEIQSATAPGGKVSYTLREKGDEKAMEDASSRTMSVLKAAFPDNPPTLEKKDFVGPVVGKDLKRRTYWAIFLSLLGIVAYVAFRFSNPVWGIVGVLELFHDVVGTAAIFSIMGMEVDLLIVTALLTIAGYSINDTIIIFDRMRENLRIKRGASFKEIVNSSINETLTRTIITVLTVQTVCVVLLIFGGPVLRHFSLAMVIGNFLGTYSSIAAAAALIYEWEVQMGGKKAGDEPAAAAIKVKALKKQRGNA